MTTTETGNGAAVALDAIVRPPCENCGQPATHYGTHPEAGSIYVCRDCITGQGFRNLRAWDWAFQRPNND